MSDTTNADRLRAIITRKRLKRREVADILGVSINTVHAWLKPEGTPSKRNCPDHMIELLELKTNARS